MLFQLIDQLKADPPISWRSPEQEQICLTSQAVDSGYNSADCFIPSFRQSPSDHEANHRLTSQDYSAGTTPRSNALSSPNVNLEFNKLIHTPSFTDIQTKIHAVNEWENGDVSQFLENVIEPNPDDVQKVLDVAGSNPFTHRISPYFTHTEQVCHLLLKLERWIHHTRQHYTPIKNLIQSLHTDSDSLNQEQCHSASEIFLHFQTKEIPNPCNGPHNLNNMHICSCNLKEQVDGCRVDKSKPMVCTSIRFVGSVFKLAMAAASVTAHALSALSRGSSFSTVPKLSKKDIAYIALLDNAARSAYTLHNEVQTIERLAHHIQTEVESDRSYIGVCTGRGHESYLIMKLLTVKGVFSSREFTRFIKAYKATKQLSVEAKSLESNTEVKMNMLFRLTSSVYDFDS
ncbi:hypothetical protein V2J09_012459 [Rumex salicifolius]